MTAEQEAALLEKVQKFEQDITKLTGQVSGAETLLQQHKTEMGDARKQIKDALETTTNLVKKDELQKALDKLGKIEENISLNTGNQGAPGKTLEELQSVLIDTAKVNPKVDEAWKQLTEEERDGLWIDQANLAKFVQIASQAPKPAPGSLLQQGNAPQSEDAATKRFQALFAGTAKASNFVPGGERRGATGYAGATNPGQQGQPQPTKRLPGGVIPRPSAPA